MKINLLVNLNLQTDVIIQF